MSEIHETTIEVMQRAVIQLAKSVLTERELRARIETQRARIDVARGYLLAGRSDLAAMVLTDEPEISAQLARQASVIGN